MKILQQIKDERGFTIQEILVVMIVGSILLSLSLALFQFTNELFQSWYGTNEFKSDVNRIIQTMALDIQHSSEIIEQTDTSLVLSRGLKQEVRYIFGGQFLRRNDVELTPQKCKTFLIKLEEIQTEKTTAKAFRIKILAQSKWTSYGAEIVASAIQSSTSEFTAFYRNRLNGK